MKTQGIEARSGETGTGSTEGESPSGKAGAPKLDWTAPLMLDDGKGTGVEDVRGPDSAGQVHVLIDGAWRFYGSDGYAVYNLSLPRIINRPKPDAEPVEQLPADEGEKFEARQCAERPWIWQVWDITHSSPGNHFPVLEVDSKGASDYFHERCAKICAAALTSTPDTVTVPRMTEAEARQWWGYPGCETARTFVDRLREKGLIRPDTPLDRFTASHPNWRDLPVEEAVRLALEQRGDG